nr:ribonuclease H-like domain-containing protein [Tanacetum cinerariifolium]
MDDLKLKLEKFQSSSKNLTELLASQINKKTSLGYNSQVFTRAMFNCDDHLSSESDESWPPSSLYDRFQLSDGYHDVPSPYTGTFMPPKPDLVFTTALIDVETDHSAFTVQLNPTKPEQDLSHIHRPTTPIIEDWVSDSEDESATKAPQIVPSFVQSTEQVKSPRHSVSHVETSIPAVTPKPASPKPASSGKRRNRKACFVCKSVTRPKQVQPIVTKLNLPIRRHITRSLSPKTNNSPPIVTVVKAPVGNPQHALKDKGVIDSGCLRHMRGNISYLSDFEELNGGYVAFGCNPKGGKISGKGKIRTGKLDFGDVYFVKELKFNLFSVSQMCDKKNIVPFTDTECLILSLDFKLPNESQVLLRVPRENNMLHMDLFGPSFVKSLNKKSYFLVVTDDYSRFTWVFFLTTKDETSPILKTFITGLENQFSLKVKVIRSDNGIEFKNNDLNQFCGMKGIKREFSVPRTPQQNGISKRKNRTLIEAARTMLADSLLPIPFWAEAVNTACYVHNRMLVTKPHNKTPYELLHGRTLSIGFMRPFGCHVTILNTLDSLGKFGGSGPTWLFDIDSLTRTMNYQPVTAGHQTNPSAGFQDKFANIDGDAAFDGKEPEFDEKKHESEVIVSPSSSAQSWKQDDKTKKEAKGKSPVKSFTGYRDLSAEFKDCSDNSINEVNAAELEDITYSDDEDDVGAEADFNNLETSITVSPIPTSRVHKDHPVTQIIGDLSSTTQTRSMTKVVKDQGVNTPRCDEDRLELMELTVFLLPKVEKVGIGVSVVDLQVSAVRLMLLLVPKHLCVVHQTVLDCCCCQEEGVECLPNEDIFAELARIGYEKPSTKLTFYKSFFSSHWKFLIHTILQCMSAKRTSWNEFNSSMASAVICLSSGKGFSGVETQLFEGMLVAQEVAKEGAADEVHGEDVNTGDVTEGDVSATNDEVLTVAEEPSIPSPTPPTLPPQPSPYIPSISQDARIPMNLLQEVMDTCTALSRRFKHLELDKIAYALEITKLKRRVKKLERRNKVKVLKLRRLQKVGTTQRVETSDETVMDDVSNQGRMIAEMDQDADVALEDDKEVADDVKDVQDDIEESAQNQGRKAKSQAEIYKIDLEHANKVLSMQEDKSEPTKVQEVVDVVTTAKIITEVVTAATQVPAATLTAAPARVTAAPSRRRKGVVIRDLQEESTTSIIIPAETKSKDKGKGILVEEPKPLKKQQQIEQDEKYARELEAELNKNINWDEVIDHVKKKAKEDPVNVAGFKMDYFKGMSYDDIRPIFEAKFNTNMAFLLKTKEQIKEEESIALKRLNETPAEKAAKRQKLDEEVEELKRHLQIVPKEDDDVYIESTPTCSQGPCC